MDEKVEILQKLRQLKQRDINVDYSAESSLETLRRDYYIASLEIDDARNKKIKRKKMEMMRVILDVAFTGLEFCMYKRYPFMKERRQLEKIIMLEKMAGKTDLTVDDSYLKVKLEFEGEV